MLIANWTPLPPLPLRRNEASGTTESLYHYALRMSDICGVSIYLLASILKNEAGEQGARMSAQYMSSWIGPRSHYKGLMESLMKLTGQPDLYRGTFHNVAGVLGRQGLSTRDGREHQRRWCPRCYLEWDEGTSFEPLHLAFSQLSICPIHGVLLEGRCSQCGAAQSFLRSYASRRNCQACRCPLGHSGEWRELEAFPRWVDGVLRRFGCYVSALDDPIPEMRIEVFMAGLHKRILSGERLPPAVRGYLWNRVNSRRRHNALPTLTQYLNLCAFQGCEIGDILERPEEVSSAFLFDRADGFTQVPLRRRDIQGNLAMIGSCMDRLCSDAEVLPPLALLCREFGVWADVVREHYPDLHHRYRSRYLAQNGEFSRTHVKRALERALQVVKMNECASGRERQKDIALQVMQVVQVAPELALQCAKSITVMREFSKRIPSTRVDFPFNLQGMDAWQSGK